MGVWIELGHHVSLAFPYGVGPIRIAEVALRQSGLSGALMPVQRRDHEPFDANLCPIRRTLRAALRHRLDAAWRLHVLVRRRTREISGGDLCRRAIAVVARLRRVVRAVTPDLASPRRVRADGAAVAA